MTKASINGTYLRNEACTVYQRYPEAAPKKQRHETGVYCAQRVDGHLDRAKYMKLQVTGDQQLELNLVGITHKIESGRYGKDVPVSVDDSMVVEVTWEEGQRDV
jgi:hypothetical protein